MKATYIVNEKDGEKFYGVTFASNPTVPEDDNTFYIINPESGMTIASSINYVIDTYNSQDLFHFIIRGKSSSMVEVTYGNYEEPLFRYWFVCIDKEEATKAVELIQTAISMKAIEEMKKDGQEAEVESSHEEPNVFIDDCDMKNLKYRFKGGRFKSFPENLQYRIFFSDIKESEVNDENSFAVPSDCVIATELMLNFIISSILDEYFPIVLPLNTSIWNNSAVLIEFSKEWMDEISNSGVDDDYYEFSEARRNVMGIQCASFDEAFRAYYILGDIFDDIVAEYLNLKGGQV